MNQLSTFTPNNGPRDFNSMVIDMYNYGNGLCRDQRPDIFVVLGEGDADNVTIDCGRLKLVTDCGTQMLLLDHIVKNEVGAHIHKLACTAATKKMYRLTCATTTSCDTKVMRVGLKQFNACTNDILIRTVSKDFTCSGDIECPAKIAAFVAAFNASDAGQYATAAIDPSDPTRMTIEWKVAGEDFTIEYAEGFEPIATADESNILEYGTPAIGSGKDLVRYFKATDCLPSACDADKCYTLYFFKYWRYLSLAGHGLFSSSSAINNNNTQGITFLNVVIAVDDAAADVIVALDGVLTTAGLLCGDEAQPPIPEEFAVVCITRDDDGDAAALAAMEVDYADAESVVLSSAEGGTSKYQLVVKKDLLPLDPADAEDVIEDGPCA